MPFFCLKVFIREPKPTKKGIRALGMLVGECLEGSCLKLVSVYVGCPFGGTRNVNPISCGLRQPSKHSGSRVGGLNCNKVDDYYETLQLQILQVL